MGKVKRHYEARVETACQCEGGCCFDIDEHDVNCPAIRVIKYLFGYYPDTVKKGGETNHE